MKNFEKIIAYEDTHVLILDKPVGMASQSERGFEEDLLSATLNYYAQKGQKNSYVAVVNRLDKPVGGLVLMAKDKQTAAKLSAMSGEHSIEKWYYALVNGEVTTSGEYTDYLVRDGRSNTSKVCDAKTPQAKKAVLAYEPLGIKQVEGKNYTLVRVRLYTGRHHQIRVQMAAHNHALYGDTKYNPDFANRRGISPALYAYHLSFHNPYGADVITVESNPPRTESWAMV